jgi:hypothetical protein
MAERELRCPYQVFANFLKLDPDDHEIVAVRHCMAELKRNPLVADNLIPFSAYKRFPNSYFADAERFLVIYTFDPLYVDVLEILSGDEY